jgi:Planctomycete cytochrome C
MRCTHRCCVLRARHVIASIWTPRWPASTTPAPGRLQNAREFLDAHCVECHGSSSPEGNLSLHDLGPADEINSGIWKSVWAQVTLKEMPPKDANQPEVVKRLAFSDWIVSELTHAMRDKGGFHDHLDPNKGNFVDHNLLFGQLPDGIKLIPSSSPARLWRATPQELITRHNELINTESLYDPQKPGLRSHGDAVPTNHGGELKLYFGTDNIIQWQGGTVAYATAVKSVPSILSSARKNGLENYPEFYTVNSAEATQIMSLAGELIRYMAYGPLSIAQPYQITDDPESIADKMQGDLRGLPTSLVYSTKVLHPITPVYDLMKDEEITDERLRNAVDYLFEALTFRPPSETETDAYSTIVKQSIEKLGKKGAWAIRDLP